jgi:hypothetical protein
MNFATFTSEDALKHKAREEIAAKGVLTVSVMDSAFSNILLVLETVLRTSDRIKNT